MFACMNICASLVCPGRPEEDIGTLGTGVPVGYKSTYKCWGPLEEKQAFSTTEPSSIP